MVREASAVSVCHSTPFLVIMQVFTLVALHERDVAPVLPPPKMLPPPPEPLPAPPPLPPLPAPAPPPAPPPLITRSGVAFIEAVGTRTVTVTMFELVEPPGPVQLV